MGIPRRVHSGESISEKADKAPEADKNSMATISPTKDGNIDTAHFSPFIPPSVNAPHMFTFFVSAKRRIADIKIGIINSDILTEKGNFCTYFSRQCANHKSAKGCDESRYNNIRGGDGAHLRAQCNDRCGNKLN